MNDNKKKDLTKSILFGSLIFLVFNILIYIQFFYLPHLEEAKEQLEKAQWYAENEEYVMDARSECFAKFSPSDSESSCITSTCNEENLAVHDMQNWVLPVVYCGKEHNSSLEKREKFDVCDVQSVDCQRVCAQRTEVTNCIKEAGADWKWRENMPK